MDGEVTKFSPFVITIASSEVAITMGGGGRFQDAHFREQGRGLTTPPSLSIAQAIRPVSKQIRADSIIMNTIAITFYIMECEERRYHFAIEVNGGNEQSKNSSSSKLVGAVTSSG